MHGSGVSCGRTNLPGMSIQGGGGGGGGVGGEGMNFSHNASHVTHGGTTE